MYTAPSAHTPRTAAIQDAEDLCRQYPNKCSSWLTLYKAKVKIDPFYKPDYEFEQMKNRCDDFNGFYREAEETANQIIGKSVSDFISVHAHKRHARDSICGDRGDTCARRMPSRLLCAARKRRDAV